MVQSGTENILQKFVESVFYAADNFLMFSVDSYLYLALVRCLLNTLNVLSQQSLCEAQGTVLLLCK